MAVLLMYIIMVVVSWIPFAGWVAWIVPLVFYIKERSSGFVKFHAVQAVGIGILRAVIAIIIQIIVWILMPKDLGSALGYLTGQGWGALVALSVISTIIGVAITILIIYMVYTAWKYQQVELPVLGPIAAKACAKMSDFAGQHGFGADNKDQK